MNMPSLLFAGLLAAVLNVVNAHAENGFEYRSGGTDPRVAPRAYGYPQGVAPYPYAPYSPYGNRVPPATNAYHGNARQQDRFPYSSAFGSAGNQRPERDTRNRQRDTEADYHGHRNGRDADRGYRDDRRSDRRRQNGQRQDLREDRGERGERGAQSGLVTRPRQEQRRYPPPAYGPYSAPAYGPYSAPAYERYDNQSRPYRR